MKKHQSWFCFNPRFQHEKLCLFVRRGRRVGLPGAIFRMGKSRGKFVFFFFPWNIKKNPWFPVIFFLDTSDTNPMRLCKKRLAERCGKANHDFWHCLTLDLRLCFQKCLSGEMFERFWDQQRWFGASHSGWSHFYPFVNRLHLSLQAALPPRPNRVSPKWPRLGEATADGPSLHLRWELRQGARDL